MHKKNTRSAVSRPLTLITENTHFQVVEAYKTVRTNLLFALATTQENAILITSAEPNSGKSSTCANLAITMAQTGARVVIIDADMRKPVQHKMFRVSNTNGLSKVLGGLSDPVSAVFHNVVTGLDLLTAGPIPPNPSELLGSQNMASLLEQFRQSYDYIFLDTPPVNVVADCLMLTDKTAGTLLVARQKQTHYDELQKAMETIQNLNASILGLVITDVDEMSKPYGQYKAYKSYNYEYTKT